MFVITRTSGEKLEAIITLMDDDDFDRIIPPSGDLVHFDWALYKNKEVYKLCLASSDEILGAICIKDHPKDAVRAIEIVLLEIGHKNIGKKKQFDGIAGCLIAFACRVSFKRGYDGCVYLIPKTTLISHYANKYGFFHVPLKTLTRLVGLMILYDVEARSILKKYIHDED